MRYLLLIAICASALFVRAPHAQAASLCARVTGIPAQCMYDDPGECAKQAERLGGECAVNPASPPVMNGNSQYCVVMPGLITSCVFADRHDCEVDAARRQGACVVNYPEPIPPEQDPYHERRPY
jgi:hypothetical protein